MPAKGQSISEEHREAIRAWHKGQAKGQSSTKLCPKCQEVKPRSDFGLRGPNAQGKRYSKSYCKQCENVISTEKTRGNPEVTAARNRRGALQRYFNMSQDEFDELSKIQGGVCAICREAPVNHSRLHIDHDHRTGVVRGLLCRGCNHGLGNFKDSPELLQRAIAYLASDPIALQDGTTFSSVAVDDLPRHPLSDNEIDEDQVLIAEQLRTARGGRTKTSIAKAIGTTVYKITQLESTKTYRGDLAVLIALVEFYGMAAAVTETGRIVIFYPELFATEAVIAGESVEEHGMAAGLEPAA